MASNANALARSGKFGDLRRRLVFLVLALVVYRIGAHIPVPGIDPVQLNITIAAIGYYYLTNRFTGSVVFDRDLMSKAALSQRLEFNIDTILRLVRKGNSP